MVTSPGEKSQISERWPLPKAATCQNNIPKFTKLEITRGTVEYSFGFRSAISVFRVFQYRYIILVRLFLHFRFDSDIFNSNSVISDRV